MHIWFASGNRHKRQELAAILSNFDGIEVFVKIPSDAGIVFDPLENGSTFLENALIKARELYKIVHEPVIADDSGLCIDALDGRPGIYSARYGSTQGKNLTDGERNRLILKELGGTAQRKARFVCAMVLILSEDRFSAVQETLEGEIIGEEWGEGRGIGGFGYDPILFLPSLMRTAAELSEEEKNLLSHRGKAGRALGALCRQLAGYGT
jgi:XTP/dITP diphosphohydrolase